MYRKSTPIDLIRAGVSLSVMAWEAQMIIGMRMMGMAGMWNVSPGENMRMIVEKAGAAVDAHHGVARAIWAGGGPAEVALAAVKPVRRRTRANVKRLTLRGPAGKR